MQLSQQAIAHRAGIAIGTIRAIESGRTVEPGFFTIIELLDALGLSVEDALERVARRLREGPKMPPDDGPEELPGVTADVAIE